MMQNIFSEMFMANIFETHVVFNVGRKIINTGIIECVCKINTVPVYTVSENEGPINGAFQR
jgi:hypothetical protein